MDKALAVIVWSFIIGYGVAMNVLVIAGMIMHNEVMEIVGWSMWGVAVVIFITGCIAAHSPIW